MEKKKKLYLKGYEKGQREAWSQIKSMVSKYEGWDLKSRIESKLGTIYQEIDSKRVELENDPSILILDDEKEEKKEEPEVEEEETKEKMRELGVGESVLIVGDELKTGIDELRKLTDEGIPGLVISRESPSKLKQRYSLEDLDFVWLTRSSSYGYSSSSSKSRKVPPSNLSRLSSQVGGFLKNNEKGAVLLSGVSNLINYNEFEKVQELINWIADNVFDKKGFMIVFIPGSSVKKEHLDMLKDDFDFVHGLD